MKQRRFDLHGSLTASFKDGIFAAVMLGVTEHYVVPFALFMAATVQQIGWISALPNLLGSISQLFAVPLIRWLGGRLRFLVRAVFIQAVLLLGIASLAWLDGSFRLQLLLLLLVLFTVSGGLIGPAWGSLMSDHIPISRRGVYFGWRNRILGMVTVLSMAGAGLILYRTREVSPAGGFFTIFLLGAAARCVSSLYIAKMSDVPMKKNPAYDFTFWMFVARFRESNFVKFIAFVATLTFSSYLSSPFFAVFMLRELKFSYLTYMIFQTVSTVAALIALPWWGRHADVVGNVRLLRLAGFMATLIPCLWVVSHNLVYLTLLQLFAGFAWSGVTLSATNFIYDAVTPQKRIRCIGYFNVINGTALFFGAALGGFLASRLPPLMGYSLHSLFALSSLCRLVSYFALSRRFQEVRSSRAVSSRELFFSVVGIRPIVGGPHDWVFRPIRHRD
ncbi:MAG: MFS transporter [Deltaproteobacteria bacterium]|nr:MFS transporter [Deltaproteobacteria bacterium]